MRELILGGARSGKSRYAEQQARQSGLEVIYLATAEAGDEEMAKRIARHRLQRPVEWRVIEEPLALASTLTKHAALGRCLIVDCLTLWLSNLMIREEQENGRLQAEKTALLDTLPRLGGRVHLVSNEVGQGIIPDNALARRFVDEAGWLHQAVAQRCERVVWIAAGLPQVLKNPQ